MCHLKQGTVVLNQEQKFSSCITIKNHTDCGFVRDQLGTPNTLTLSAMCDITIQRAYIGMRPYCNNTGEGLIQVDAAKSLWLYKKDNELQDCYRHCIQHTPPWIQHTSHSAAPASLNLPRRILRVGLQTSRLQQTWHPQWSTTSSPSDVFFKSGSRWQSEGARLGE
jgi:hypothetical protein